jgi:hypothetical protein
MKTPKLMTPYKALKILWGLFKTSTEDELSSDVKVQRRVLKEAITHQDRTITALYQQLRIRDDEITSLQTTVSQLPRTADDVVCTGGEVVWKACFRYVVVCVPSVSGCARWIARRLSSSGDIHANYPMDVHICYSTEKADWGVRHGSHPKTSPSTRKECETCHGLGFVECVGEGPWVYDTCEGCGEERKLK